MADHALSRRLRDDAGATGTEYALVLSLLAVVCIGGAKYLTSRANTQVSNQANCVATRPPPASCQVNALVTSTTGSSVSTTSSTTLPTTPQLANSSFPTPVKGTVTIGGATYSTVKPTVTVVNSSSGAAVVGAVVRFKFRVYAPGLPNPGYLDQYDQCTTDATGKCNLTYQVPYTDATKVIVSIDSVNAPIGTGTTSGPITVTLP